jgi:hypothetical protein
MLDYVANATAFFPAEYLQERFEARCLAAGLDPEKTLGDFLQDNEKDLESFWKQVRANLSAGRIRLLFVADIIPQKLRSIIEFLNRQMGETEVLGLEVRQFVGSNLTTYVPRLIGQTSEAVQRKSVGGRLARQWTEESFFKQMEGSRPEPEVQVARRLLEWANVRELSVRWGQGGRTGSFSPRLIIGDQEHRLMSVYGYGSVEVVFIWMRALPFSDRTSRLELLHKLNTIPGVALAEEYVDARPAIQLAVLALADRLEKFLEVFDWVLAEARAYSGSPMS